MHAKTAVAVAGSVLALPGVAAAADLSDPATPLREAVRAPLAGHLTVGAHMRAAKREADTDRLSKAHLRLARRAARLSGDELPRGYRTRLRGSTPAELRERNERLRARIRELRRERRESGTTAPGGGGSTASATLQAIAACESGGNPSTNTGNGYYGKYQFSMSTWQAVGGTGSPAAASEAEQDKRAAQLYATAGAGQWPVCGR